MLGRSIYENTKRDIQDHSNKFTHQLREEILAETSLNRAIQRSNRIANSYHTELTSSIFNRLHEVGSNAVEYYAPELDSLARENEVNFALDELVHNKYYGLTLPQRLKQSHLNLRHNIRRSAAVGAKRDTRLLNITRVFNDQYPFGAQKNWDLRLFLAEAVRLEHVVAKNLAVRKAQKLVRWTLSHTHSQEDVCDRLANAVDSKVEGFIKHNKYSIDPGGIYFIDSIPTIPHPNCQCVIKYVYKTPRGRKTRPKKRMNLIQRILKAIFG